MMLLFYIAFTFLAAYALVLLWLAAGFLRQRFFGGAEQEPQAVTIIVCARNEERYIGLCLRSIISQKYPRDKMQIIVINDASSDTTVLQAEAVLKVSGINYRVVSNAQQKGKKHSITYAVQLAAHPLVITRDADTFSASPKWLQRVSDFQRSSHSDLVIAPVAITQNFGVFWALQVVENNILTVLACGSASWKKPFLCSGANLAFTKSIFERTGGYASHAHIPSGDDVLFMEDVKKIPGARIAYLKSKEAIVHTYPSPSFASLMRQKVRWASKFRQNPNPLNLSLAVLSFAVNLFWLFLFVYVYTVHKHKTLCLTFIFSKLVFDNLLLFLAAGFIKNRHIGWFALPVSCIYPVYALMVGMASLFMKSRWK